MQPWRVSIGLTVTALGLVTLLGGSELAYLKPHWRVLLSDYWWPIGFYGGLAVVTFAFLVYAGARAMGLADLGRKVDLVERGIRRGEGGDSELAGVLKNQSKGEFRE